MATVTALCRSPIWMAARPNWLARSLPSGFGSSARTFVVRVVWSTSAPTQVIRPVNVASSLAEFVPETVKLTGWPARTWAMSFS